MLTEKTVKGFLEELASESPAPGGGSVAALSASLAAGLTTMVANLTFDKKGYESQKAMMGAVRMRSTKLRERLIELVDEDTAAFNEIMAAYKMPKGNDGDKKKRSEAIQTATKHAADVPFEVAKISNELLKLTHVIAEKGNKNAITDAGSAALMADAAIQMASMNVRINMQSIKDKKFNDEMDKKLGEIEFDAVDGMGDTMALVLGEIDPDALVEEEGEGK